MLKMFEGGFKPLHMKGWELWFAGEKERAVAKWFEGALKGDPYCIDKMTWAYNCGMGVEKNEAEARKWAYKANEYPLHIKRKTKSSVKIHYWDRRKYFYYRWVALMTHNVVETLTPEVYIFSAQWGGRDEEGKYILSIPQLFAPCPRYFCTGEACDIRPDQAEWLTTHRPDDEMMDARCMYWPYAAITANTPGLAKFFRLPERKVPRVRLASEKPEFCLFFYSHDTNKRTEFVEGVSEYKPVEVYGNSMHSTKSDTPPRNPRSPMVKNGLLKDTALLEPFKFIMALENRQQRGYLTEKLPEAFMSGGIPVYWGDPDVEKHFNPRAFINANDLTMDELRERIIELDNDDDKYNAMTAEHPYRDNRLPLWGNRAPMIRRTWEIFGAPGDL